MSAIERAATEVRIGNQGKALAYVNTANEQLVQPALTKFKEGLFDVKGVQRYFNVHGRACMMDSLRLAGCAIWASVAYARSNEDYVDEFMEHQFRRGCLWLGADIEFDDRKVLHDTSILAYDSETIKAMAVGEQMTAIEFRMLYVWDDQHHRRDVVYKTY